MRPASYAETVVTRAARRTAAGTTQRRYWLPEPLVRRAAAEQRAAAFQEDDVVEREHDRARATPERRRVGRAVEQVHARLGGGAAAARPAPSVGYERAGDLDDLQVGVRAPGTGPRRGARTRRTRARARARGAAGAAPARRRPCRACAAGTAAALRCRFHGCAATCAAVWGVWRNVRLAPRLWRAPEQHERERAGQVDEVAREPAPQTAAGMPSPMATRQRDGERDPRRHRSADERAASAPSAGTARAAARGAAAPSGALCRRSRRCRCGRAPRAPGRACGPGVVELGRQPPPPLADEHLGGGHLLVVDHGSGA